VDKGGPATPGPIPAGRIPALTALARRRYGPVDATRATLADRGDGQRALGTLHLLVGTATQPVPRAFTAGSLTRHTYLLAARQRLEPRTRGLKIAAPCQPVCTATSYLQ